uniref:55kb from the right end sequence n=1 Tax=African swine fever virus TaxID=10497 RepID=Q65257_ASF|nr:unnamed protein product [African swine fever virus]
MSQYSGYSIICCDNSMKFDCKSIFSFKCRVPKTKKVYVANNYSTKLISGLMGMETCCPCRRWRKWP